MFPKIILPMTKTSIEAFPSLVSTCKVSARTNSWRSQTHGQQQTWTLPVGEDIMIMCCNWRQKNTSPHHTCIFSALKLNITPVIPGIWSNWRTRNWTKTTKEFLKFNKRKTLRSEQNNIRKKKLIDNKPFENVRSPEVTGSIPVSRVTEDLVIFSMQLAHCQWNRRTKEKREKNRDCCWFHG